MFEPVVPNPDLSIHENPPAPMDRIAVVCRWKDAHSFRRRYPDAAVVGPLRTVRGIDGFVRNLLANPQIRTVVVDGADLTPGEMTTEALANIWSARDPEGARQARRVLGKDIPGELIDALIREVLIIKRDDPQRIIPTTDEDRPSGRHVFPPRAPEATAGAPSGDPGQRIAGDTLSEVYPLALREVLDFGTEVPSKYGLTRELLGLVSVIRDPRATLVEVFEGRTSFEMTHAELLEYTRRISTDYAPTEDLYSYGSRMASQLEPFEDRLRRQPDDRGHFLTPWNPSDQEKPGGRPCLVGVQFRRLGDRLNLVANFRSHDLFAGYAHNLAALCQWLVNVADRNGQIVGAVEVMSVSAHLYDRDWNDARKVVEDRNVARIVWDQRTTWQVEIVADEAAGEGWFIRAIALTPDGSEIVRIFEGQTAEKLRTRIERSGLVTTVGNALWLGQELARAEASLADPSRP